MYNIGVGKLLAPETSYPSGALNMVEFIKPNNEIAVPSNMDLAVPESSFAESDGGIDYTYLRFNEEQSKKFVEARENGIGIAQPYLVSNGMMLPWDGRFFMLSASQFWTRLSADGSEILQATQVKPGKNSPLYEHIEVLGIAIVDDKPLPFCGNFRSAKSRAARMAYDKFARASEVNHSIPLLWARWLFQVQIGASAISKTSKKPYYPATCIARLTTSDEYENVMKYLDLNFENDLLSATRGYSDKCKLLKEICNA